MTVIRIRAPKIFSKKQEMLANFINKYNPILMIERFTGRKLKKNIIFQHKPLKMEARFGGHVIYADFNNNVKYLWICICHELAHILLRNPPWHKSKQIKEIIRKGKEVGSGGGQTFKDAMEQTLAILLQAACESRANVRKLKWSEWETTFNYMRVKELGRKFWGSWLGYLKNNLKYKNIDQWILREIKRISRY